MYRDHPLNTPRVYYTAEKHYSLCPIFLLAACVIKFIIYLCRLVSDVFDSSRCVLRYTDRAPTSLTTGTPLKRHVWSDHSQAVTSLYCGGGGLESRVVTASLDQTCKVRLYPIHYKHVH